MWWILIIGGIVVIIIIYLLFASFFIEIDSAVGLCSIRFQRIANAQLKLIDSSLILYLRIAGWQKQIDLLAKRKKIEKPIHKKPEIKRKGVSFSKVKAVIKSFKVNKCQLLIDSGNMQWNGILFPWFWWISRVSGKNFQINFINENSVVLEVENNLARIIRAYIKS